MSVISSGNTINTAFTVYGDTTANLVFTTSGSNTVAVTIANNQTTAFNAAVIEKANVTASAMGANVVYDVLTQPILYYTANATANTTINFRGNSTTTLNSMLANNQSLSVVFMNTNGAVAYYPTVFQVDGSAVTPKWQGGSAPTSGNTLSVDIYVVSLIKTANATYTVLASQSQFK
jgi:hypothetical protein